MRGDQGQYTPPLRPRGGLAGSTLEVTRGTLRYRRDVTEMA